jgi:phospholipid/cholesterol/gamma-HCH transport system substrate-binding protein
MTASRTVAVGVFVVGGFFLFALGLFWIGDRRLLFTESLELQTEFANLSGLKTGSKVMVSGMDAGEVLSIQVPPGPGRKFTVRFRVVSSFRPVLRTDSVASIQVEGLVGSKVLQVDKGTEAAAEVANGATLPSREPVEIAAVIQQSVDMIRKIDGAVDDVQARIIKTIDTVGQVGEQAQKLVVNTGNDIDEILEAGKKITKGVNGVVDDIQQGRGLAGKLLKDEKLYPRIETTMKNVETATRDMTQATGDIRKIVADVEKRKLGDSFEKTAANVQQATAQLKEILAEIKPEGGPDQRSLLADVRDTLVNAREATSDLAENMEALKRNWFFRGYFNKRGFYDLDAVSLDDYKKGKVAPKLVRDEHWLAAAELFRMEQGREVLSEEGAAKIGMALAPYLRLAPNTLLMVEGYAVEGAETERFLRSRDRAQQVRRYLIDRYGLKPNFVGAMPMGADSGAGQSRAGVNLVFFQEKKQ